MRDTGLERPLSLFAQLAALARRHSLAALVIAALLLLAFVAVFAKDLLDFAESLRSHWPAFLDN